MLDSYPMVKRNGLLFYPEEVRERFAATGPLPLRDGTEVPAGEIWEFMTEEAPSRFPYAFASNPNCPQRPPYQVDLLSSIKLYYLALSRRFRVEKLRKQGKPLIFVQGGQTLEPYYAAESVPLRPGDLQHLATYYMAERLSLRNKEWKQMDLHEEGNRAVSMEACHQSICHAAIRNGLVPIELMAPYTRARCSDVTFLVESHRRGSREIGSFLVDYPVNYEPRKSWAVQYVAAGIRGLIARIDAITGRSTTEKDFEAQVRVHNRVRGLARETINLWRSAPIPPASSAILYRVLALGKDCDGDPVAAEHVLTQLRDEVRERVAARLKGAELAERPVRIFKCGSCFDPNLHALDSVGGALVGADDWWSDIWVPEIEVQGDPFESYARATLAAPYDLPSEMRARWVADQIKESRADGMVFGYQWGCNFQSAIARLVCDVVVKETGIPNITLGVDELGRGESLEQTNNRIEAFVEMLSCT